AKLKQELERAAASTGDDATKAVEAMGCAYVDFALRHPAYFQVMFRADAVPLENYPEVQRQEDAAFGRLVQMIDDAFGARPAEARQKIAIVCWALVHGLATLLLEGSLARKVGVSKARQRQLAAEVIQTFSEILERGSA
ncbi:MAG TPA: TetR-like C-terminal domain-containing protein, partial [Methyloceanibacter sp.]|nr:TetR-like C-terminal domain-containing protein [Methyloceanibacter sp.]